MREGRGGEQDERRADQREEGRVADDAAEREPSEPEDDEAACKTERSE